MRKFAARAIRRLINRDVKAMAVWLDPLAEALGGDVALVADVVARGVVEGGFEPKTIYREDSDAAPPVLDELVLIAPGGDAAALAKAAERGQIIGEGANVARRLSNRAANDVTPQVLADEARAIAEDNGLTIDVVDEKRAAELGMGMFLAVGQGSANKPRMIVMRSGGEGEKDALGRHLAIVGKGVCFDSGGISIKPGDRMEEMKMDKTGACTVIAAIATVARAVARAPAARRRAGGREHARRRRDPARRHRQGDERQVGRHHQHRRRGPADPGRRDDLRRAAGRDAHRGRRDADRRRRPRVRQHRHRGVRDTPTRGGTSSTAAADRAGERYWRIPLIKDYMSEMESWYADIQNTGTPDGLARQERPVPRAVPDGAVGPSRHRRDRLLPQDVPVRASRRDRGHPRDARGAGAGGGGGGLTIGGPRGPRVGP